MKSTLARTLLVAAAYGVLAKYSLIFVGSEGCAFFWPPSGFMLGVLLLRPRGEWPLLSLAFFIANAVANAIGSDRISVSLGFGVANCVESLAAAWLLTRFLGASLTMGKLREVIGLITLAALVSNAFTAMLGAAVTTLGFGAPFWSAWRVWWIADSVGMLLVTPVTVSWVASGRPRLKSLSRPRILEGTALFTSMMTVAYFVFSSKLMDSNFFLPLPYATFPFLLWAAGRFGPRGGSLASLVVALIAVWHTLQGAGPFGVISTQVTQRVLSVQAFLSVAALCSLMLAAVISEVKAADDRLRFLAEMGISLGSTLDAASILNTIAARCVPRLADWCMVEIRTGEGRIEELAASHVDPAKVDLVRQIHSWLSSEEGRSADLAKALRTGAPQLLKEVTDRDLARTVNEPDALQRLRTVGFHSAIVVPISARAGMIGAIALVRMTARRRFDASDLAHAEELARRAGLAVDNAYLYREAQETIQLRDEFLAVAGHELKTPLAALSLHLDALLLEAGVLSQRAPALASFQDKLKRSINHAGRLGGLIQQLLDVSRIRMGKLELQLEMVDLGKVVEEVAGRFMEQAAQAGCSLKVAPPPQPVMGYWDPLQLDRVTTNLISNAVKYGAGKPVEIAVIADGGKATLSVKDQGIGISPADQKRIFQRFVRAVSQRHYGGLGLGLWITRQALEAMGGSIRVQSTPSVETVFVAELPLRTAP
ncbi:MAG TPA: MASE1 domain-containing protein [Myxococcales bacterium]|nr:MASE1 domain-containing protein [Myxococcales bacterium]